MNLPTSYLLNVAMHAGVLSAFSALLLIFLRLPQRRSFVAIAGLLVVGFLPWITALRPAPTPRALSPVTEFQAAPPPADLPIWTIVTVPVKNEVVAPLIPPTAVEKKWELPDFLTGLLVLWVTGSGIGLALFALAFLKVMLWKKSLTHLDDTAWRKLRGFIPNHLAKNDFLICPGNASPCVIGFLRPRIVIPSFLLDQLSEEKLRWAIRHEISHREAGDSRWMLLFTLIRCVNWWNPLTHHLVAIWAGAREQLCDLHATSLADNRADYAEFLVAMARKITKQPPLAVAMAKRLHARRLKQRIVSLLHSKTDGLRPLGKGFAGVSSGLFVCAAVVVSVLKIGAEEISKISNTRANEFASEPTESAPAEKTVLPSPVSLAAGEEKTLRTERAAEVKHVKRQIKITSKFILTDLEIGFFEKIPNGGRATLRSMYSDGQIQMIMRGLAQKKGTMLMTSPSMIAKSGENTKMEITRAAIGTPEQIAKRGDNTSVPFVGVSMSYLPQFSHEMSPPPANEPDVPAPSDPVIELKQTVDYRYIPGEYQPIEDSYKSRDEQSKGLDPEKIKTIQFTVEASLFSGYTVWFDLGEVEPGKNLSVLTCAEAIDESGRAIDFQKLIGDRESIIVNKRRANEGTLPLKEIQGSLRLSATFVDLPLTKPRPPGEGLVIGLTPSAKSVADKIQATRGGKVRKLKTVDVPLNQRTTPWPEFPGLNLTALASRNHQVISLTSHAIGTGEEEFPNTWEQAPGDVMNFGIRTADKGVERRLLITIEGVE